ncbi:hypothetical protein BT63DRAFT_329293 [Microthyrium microscopicum]|uniref:Uncharacterized protein n=1 Tax=Microthyrium microscopicum TaxID=703497 RepID=A0A6A6U5A9_9PEZI|nr:hypothetical protein BT63DRAFT_329293 [Microthyrium microscopicum]
MRRLATCSSLRGQLYSATRPCPASIVRLLPQTTSKRYLANVRDHGEYASNVWFSSSSVHKFAPDHKPVDERKLKLGKTIRTLHERLPTLLATPLPQDILSPQITLRLFPSTHPHLPSVTGRIAYTAALWTSPVAWGRMPVLGNVKLIILSERMMRHGKEGSEKLVVRWKTCVKTRGDVTEQIKKMIAILGRGQSKAYAEQHEFHGLFIFEFDGEGRISSHTIEHVEERNNWETARVISVTDWLLGKAWGKKEEVPELAICDSDNRDRDGNGHGQRRS